MLLHALCIICITQKNSAKKKHPIVCLTERKTKKKTAIKYLYGYMYMIYMSGNGK